MASIATGSLVANVIDQSLDLLLGSARENLNITSSGVAVTDTVINLGYVPGAIQQGTYIEIDQELMYVWSSTTSATVGTVTVQRGMRSTAAVAHGANTLVRVNPYFPRYQVANAIQAEIGSWGPQLYRVNTINIPLVNYVAGYDLGVLGDFHRIIDVRESPDLELGYVSDQAWARIKWEVLQAAPRSQFPSGNALFIVDPLGVWDSPQTNPRTVHVIYAAPFNFNIPFVENTDVVAQVGVDPNELDIIPYGVGFRLLQGREARRALTENMGAPNTATAVPPMYASQASAAFKKIRDDRIGDAMVRLMTKYGVRGK